MTDTKPGFKVSANLILYTSVTPDGRAVAWFQQDGEPVLLSEEQPHEFHGDTRYKAQCKALGWLGHQRKFALARSGGQLTLR